MYKEEGTMNDENESLNPPTVESDIPRSTPEWLAAKRSKSTKQNFPQGKDGRYTKEELVSLFNPDYSIPEGFVFHDKITTKKSNIPLALQPETQDENTSITYGSNPSVRGKGGREGRGRGRGRGKRDHEDQWDEVDTKSFGRGRLATQSAKGKLEKQSEFEEDATGTFDISTLNLGEDDLFGPLEPDMYEFEGGDEEHKQKELEIETLRQQQRISYQTPTDVEEYIPGSEKKSQSSSNKLESQKVQLNALNTKLDISKIHIDEGHHKSDSQSKLPFRASDSQTSVNNQQPHLTNPMPLSPKEQNWYYVDPANNTQGPFTSSQMDKWLRHNYFKSDLQVRKENERQYSNLGNLFLREQRNPFTKVPLQIWLQPPVNEFKMAIYQLSQIYQQRQLQQLLDKAKEAPSARQQLPQNSVPGPIFGPVMGSQGHKEGQHPTGQPFTQSYPQRSNYPMPSMQQPTAKSQEGLNWNQVWLQQQQLMHHQLMMQGKMMQRNAGTQNAGSQLNGSNPSFPNPSAQQQMQYQADKNKNQEEVAQLWKQINTAPYQVNRGEEFTHFSPQPHQRPQMGLPQKLSSMSTPGYPSKAQIIPPQNVHHQDSRSKHTSQHEESKDSQLLQFTQMGQYMQQQQSGVSKREAEFQQNKKLDMNINPIPRTTSPSEANSHKEEHPLQQQKSPQLEKKPNLQELQQKSLTNINEQKSSKQFEFKQEDFPSLGSVPQKQKGGKYKK